MVARSIAQRARSWWSAQEARVQQRWIGFVLVAGTAPVLGLASWLEADPSGVGTHKQLGLGGCTVLTLTGWPCPMCGMTTTFTHMGHLQPLDALTTQPFGVVLYLCTLGMFVLGVGALLGKAWWRSVAARVLQYEVQIASGILAGMAAGWLYKCTAMGLFGDPVVG